MALFCSASQARAHENDPYKGSIEVESRSGRVRPLAPPARPLEKVPLQERIFNSTLSKEFDERYRQAFGQTDAEQNYNQPSTITIATMDNGVGDYAVIEEERRRAFGQYMVRRLAEWHIDNYAKNDPQVRPAWELKERVSQVKAEVAPGYRLQSKYFISGNLVETRLENPFARAKIINELDSSGPTHSAETTYDLGRDLTSTVAVDLYYKQLKDQVLLVGTKALGPGLTASLTGGAIGRHDGAGREGEKLVLAGLSWNY